MIFLTNRTAMKVQLNRKLKNQLAWELKFFTLLTGLSLLLAGPVHATAGQTTAGNVSVKSAVTAFPGAEGHGSGTPGGRGGKVCKVTSLNDSGTGSLREAISIEGPRTVVFEVSGTIRLKSPLLVEDGNLTIAGQTAPGDGICLAGYGMEVHADDVVIRYIRIRPGSAVMENENRSALLIEGCRNVVIDHCSISWASGGMAVIRDSTGICMQWCILGESLPVNRPDPGLLIHLPAGGEVSIHHNLFQRVGFGAPRLTGKNMVIDFRNNVVQGSDTRGGFDFEASLSTLVLAGNVFLQAGFPAFSMKAENGKAYVSDNRVEGQSSGDAGFLLPGDVPVLDSDDFLPEVTTFTPEEARIVVLSLAGASIRRDSADREFINYTQNQGPLTERDFSDPGTWPVLAQKMPVRDSDEDGIPDYWERVKGTEISQPDASADRDRDGRTNLEEYINSLVPAEHVPAGENGPKPRNPLEISLGLIAAVVSAILGVKLFAYLTKDRFHWK